MQWYLCLLEGWQVEWFSHICLFICIFLCLSEITERVYPSLQKWVMEKPHKEAIGKRPLCTTEIFNDQSSFNSVVVFWPLPLDHLLFLSQEVFPCFMSHLSTGNCLVYWEMSHFPLSHLSTYISSWLPWIFLFVFVFSFFSPWGDPRVAEWPEITDALFAFQADWSYRGYSSLWHDYLWGSRDKDSGWILDSGLCSPSVSYPFLYFLPFFFFFDLFFIAKKWFLFLSIYFLPVGN